MITKCLARANKLMSLTWHDSTTWWHVVGAQNTPDNLEHLCQWHSVKLIVC